MVDYMSPYSLACHLFSWRRDIYSIKRLPWLSFDSRHFLHVCTTIFRWCFRWNLLLVVKHKRNIDYTTLTQSPTRPILTEASSFHQRWTCHLCFLCKINSWPTRWVFKVATINPEKNVPVSIMVERVRHFRRDRGLLTTKSGKALP